MLRRKGFTLIELLVVVAIISLLAAIAVPRLADRIRRARMVRAEADISGIGNALAMLTTDGGASILMLLREQTVVYRAFAPPIPRRSGSGRLTGWDGGLGRSATSLVNGLFVSTLEYAPGAVPWGGVLKDGVYKTLSSAYMEKGLPKDPWGNEYQMYLAPPAREDRYDWARGLGDYADLLTGFRSYRAPGWDVVPPALDNYLFSKGEDRSNNNLHPSFGSPDDVYGARVGYDDINNWDADRGWAEVYR